MSKDKDQIRDQVSRAYGQAMEAQEAARAATGCCGTTGCCGPTDRGSVTADLAGYAPADLLELPAGATGSSFGCGNPLGHDAIKPGDVVLDLGSGAGLDLLLAARAVGPEGRVMGVDMTEQMLRRARRNIAASGLSNVEVRRGIIEELPVGSGSVDLVISNCVINLSPEKERVFAEIARVLGPGGRMVISDIMVRDLPDWVRASEAFYSSCVAGAVDEEAYLAGLTAAGLLDARVEDRLVYEAGQLTAFIQQDLTLLDSASGEQRRVDPEAVASALEGKVWSARVSARKPAK